MNPYNVCVCVCVCFLLIYSGRTYVHSEKGYQDIIVSCSAYVVF